jgi:site-specific recombinase XerD
MNRYRLVYRGIRNAYYAFDTQTNKRESLGTGEEAEAKRLLGIKNEAVRHSDMNLQIAQVYLQHSDPALTARTWQDVMDTIVPLKSGSTRVRWATAIKDKALDGLRNRKLLETTAEHFLTALRDGTVGTNIYLRRMHSFAFGMKWIPWTILPRLQWPKVTYKDKRAITLDEHQRIVAREGNTELRAFYELLWHLGGAQSDVAALTAEDVCWADRTVSFRRCKTDVAVVITIGPEAETVLRSLPTSGFLFPWLAKMNQSLRGNHFLRRLESLEIKGVTLHSYRYSWAERAKLAGMPERYAMQALGHRSESFARAYSKKAKVVVPSLEAYEAKIVSLPLPIAVNQ